jgi:hypothetical protein
LLYKSRISGVTAARRAAIKNVKELLLRFPRAILAALTAARFKTDLVLHFPQRCDATEGKDMTNLTKTIALAAAALALAFTFAPATASASSASGSITITMYVPDCVGKDANTPTCLRRHNLAAMPAPTAAPALPPTSNANLCFHCSFH